MVAAMFVLSFSGGHATGSPVAAETAPPDDSVPPTTVFNEFIPENRDLSECISALPEPDCGSEARGGSRQLLIFGLVVLSMILIGARIAYGVHKGRTELDKPTVAEDTTGGDES